MSDEKVETPRTDAFYKDRFKAPDAIDFARQLERELSAKCAELERVKGEMATEQKQRRIHSETIRLLHKEIEDRDNQIDDWRKNSDKWRERATTAEAALEKARENEADANRYRRLFQEPRIEWSIERDCIATLELTMFETNPYSDADPCEISKEDADKRIDAAIDAARTK